MKTAEIQQDSTYPRHPEIRTYSPGSGASSQFPPFISGGLSKYDLNLQKQIKETRMLKAKDIMTENIISVREDTPIYEAVEIIVKHGISGMPVVKDDMALVGIVSEKDLIKLFYDKEGEHNKVRDFMTQPAVHFDEDESLLDVCDFLMKNIFRRVPITSRGNLAGIISIKDVLGYILELSREDAVTC